MREVAEVETRRVNWKKNKVGCKIMRKLSIAILMLLVLSGIAYAVDVDPMIYEQTRISRLDTLIPVVIQMNPGYRNVDVVSLGGKMGHQYQLINGFSAEVPSAALEKLANDVSIFAITYDKPVKPHLNVATPTLNSNFLWLEGYTGQGVTIAIIDTGIYPHPDFQNRIVGFKDFINNRTVAYDDNGHGTHGAGCAAGNGTVYDGPARDANLVGVKVLDANGSGMISTVIAGLDWIVANKDVYSIDVLGITMGAIVTQSSTTDPLCAAIRNVWNAGIVVCCSAGSSGPNLQTITCPGNEPLIISVGASDDRSTIYVTDDTVAPFSSRGPSPIDGWAKPDVVAPGINVTACTNSAANYVTWSGASASTQLVAGICAQYLEAHPGTVPARIKGDIKGSARPLQGYDANAQGSGLVDAYYAVH